MHSVTLLFHLEMIENLSTAGPMAQGLLTAFCRILGGGSLDGEGRHVGRTMLRTNGGLMLILPANICPAAGRGQAP